jgi:copper oxidase (laccase) domain-containing protein
MAAACWSVATTTGLVRALTSDRSDGDFHAGHAWAGQPEGGDLDRRRRALVDLPWTMLDEHHGTTVVRVGAPGDGDGMRGDIAITDAGGAVLGVWAGDCAPVVVVTPGGRIAAVHAGWRGLADGVLDVAVDAVAGEPGAVVPAGTVAYVGPCIGACCYAFGVDELHRVALGVGTEPASIEARTTAGAPAMDIVAAVAAALARRGVSVDAAGRCTGCDPTLFSHRARGDRGRHVLAVWKDATVVA